MGSVDIAKQAPNVLKMKVLGAKIVEVTAGAATLKEAVDSAFAAYQKEYKTAFYCLMPSLPRSKNTFSSTSIRMGS